MKIIVYAICKNEAKFVDRWYQSMQEADQIFVLDTGSTDNTVELLRKKNVIVKAETIKSWRFDRAQNKDVAIVLIDINL